MKRVTKIAILIAVLFSALVNWNSAHAASPVIAHVFIADYEIQSPSGSYYAAAYTPDDTWIAIKITAVKQVHYEDDLALDSHNFVISSTLRLDSPTFTNNHHRFTWAYLDDSDIGTIDNVDSSGSITYGTVNGDQAQFTGFVVNGPMFLLREADAFSVHGTGWIVQNGNLISYVVSNGESAPAHTINLPLILR